MANQAKTINQKGDLMSYRPDIKLLDATIRDGGLVNNFGFSDEFVKELYKTNIKSGVEYMEFGYKASKELFDVEEFGKWKFCDEEDIRAIVGENDSPLKLSVMADVGRCDFKKDILPKSESVIDMIRIATYTHQMPGALEMINYCHDMGYETTINIMAVSASREDDIAQALDLVAKSPVDVIYLVDSYGSLFPEQVRRLTAQYCEVAEASDKKVGVHMHNNQQLAFANTIESISHGASFADATMSGMGRGAGNCFMEQMLSFLRNPNYKLTPTLKFVEKYVAEERAKGSQWGYDVPYMLTGALNRHPRAAIAFLKDNRTDYNELYMDLLNELS